MTTINTALAGEYRIEVKHGDGTVTDTGWFDNLILDSGLNRLAAVGGEVDYCRIGSGTSTPTNTQTSLDTQVASQFITGNGFTTRVSEGAPNYKVLYTFVYPFAQGAVVGTMTEIGTGWAATGSTLFSRALIVDNLGTPTSITLVAIDQLTVYYRLRVVPSVVDTTGSVTIASTTYNFTCRAANVGNMGNGQSYLFAGNQAGVSGYGRAFYPYGNISTYAAGSALGAVTGAPSGTVINEGCTFAIATYNAGQFYQDHTMTWTPAQANHAGGIQCMRLVWGINGYFEYQFRFDTPILKTNTNTLTLQIRFAWSRA